jgi:UPF0755 protein
MRTKRPKKIVKWFIGGIILAVLVFFYYNLQYQYDIETPVDPNDSSDISFVIKQGENVQKIAKNLAEKGLIVSESSFKLYNRFHGTERDIKAGRFILNKTLTIPNIVATITSSKQSEAVLLVPEGYTIAEIDQKLVSMDLIEAGEFMLACKNFNQYEKYSFLDAQEIKTLSHPLEGFLFPDTYFLDFQNFRSEDLIDLMLKNFGKKFDSLNPSLTAQGKSIFEVITMASIVEKEANKSQDLPVVSGILWKRLEKNMQLGADATLLYLKQDRTITYEDLKESSPYNTRKFTGLPPGPISNPGLESIKAALHPEESPYLYYLHRADNGEIVYAQTNDEHNRNRERYL